MSWEFLEGERRRNGSKAIDRARFFSLFLLFRFLARVNAAESPNRSTGGPLACSRPRTGEKRAREAGRERETEREKRETSSRGGGLLCQSLSFPSCLLALFLPFTPARSARSSSSSAVHSQTDLVGARTRRKTNERDRKGNERAPAFFLFLLLLLLSLKLSKGKKWKGIGAKPNTQKKAEAPARPPRK